VGEPGERMPISGLSGSKGPTCGLARESPLHLRIVSNVDIIVVVDKLMILYLPVNTKDRYNQNQTYKSFPSHGGHTLLSICSQLRFLTCGKGKLRSPESARAYMPKAEEVNCFLPGYFLLATSPLISVICTRSFSIQATMQAEVS
jgi:hypothetical protein